MEKKELSIEQVSERASKLVQDEVRYCVSMLVSGLQKIVPDLNSDQLADLGIDDEQIMAISVKDDWQGAAEAEGFEMYEVNGDYVALTKNDIKDHADENELPEPDVKDKAAVEAYLDEHWDGDTDSDEDDAWRSACDRNRIEPDRIEAYEHWAVSDWLAGKLAERGEMVDTDFAGLTVWGRTTTGQMIYMDWVIQDIAKELLSD